MSSEKLLNFVYQPYKIIIGNFGFFKGYKIHFRVIPVKKGLMEEIKSHPNYTKENLDGIDVLTYVYSEYCERSLNENEQNLLINTVNLLKDKYSKLLNGMHKYVSSLPISIS